MKLNLLLEKMKQTQKIIWDYQPDTKIQERGSLEEELNYRKKSNFSKIGTESL